MATRGLHSCTQRCVEPPRDGEFELQAQISAEERIAGYVERTAWKLAAASVGAWDTIMRYPVLSACLAIAVGVIVTSLFMITPPAS